MEKEKIKVLIIEDSESDELLLLRELSKAGFQVDSRREETPDGVRDALDNDSWDIIISDYDMPQFTGLDAFQLYSDRGLDIPFIIVSGTIGEETAVNAMKAGVHDYLMKGKLNRLGPTIRRELYEAEIRKQYRLGGQRIRHLNRILHAIRNVNKLIIREKDPQRLIDSVCLELVETREYRAAMIVLMDYEEMPLMRAWSGENGCFDSMFNHLGLRDLPNCAQEALDRSEVKVIKTPSPLCSSCPHLALNNGYGSLTRRLEGLGAGSGMISVSVPAAYLEDEEELLIFSEFVDDISHALQSLKSERLRREAESRLSAAVKGGSVGLWDWNLLTDNVYFSDEWKAQIGYSSTEIGNVFTEWESRVHSDDLPNVLEEIKNTLSNLGHLYETEYRFRHKDDTFRWILARASVEYGNDGKPQRMVGSHVDISEHKRESRLRDARLRLLEYAAKKSLKELLQYALDEIESLSESNISFCHFVQPDQKTLQLQTWSTRTLTEFCTADGTGLHYDIGSAGVWVDCVYQRQPVIHNDYASLAHRRGMPPGHATVARELVVPVFRDGVIVALFGVGNKSTNYDDGDIKTVSDLADVVWEIVDKKRAEADRERLLSAIEQAGESIEITDRDGNITYVNPAFERITGYSLAELAGKNPRLLKSGKHDQKFYAELWHTITGGNIWKGRFINRRKDGSLFDEEATISPVYDSHGELQNYVAVKRDITEHLILTSRIQQAQKLEALGTLAGGIAHDFNNILTSILGFAEIAQSNLNDQHRIKEYLEEITTGGKRAVGLVHQILTIARQSEQQTQPLKIQLIVKEALKLLRPTISSNIAIDLDLDMEAPEIIADPTEIHQVIMNLCVNANHAMQQADRRDGHRLTIGVAAVQLKENEKQALGVAESPCKFLKVSITDTGCGISKDVMAKMFDPYFTTKSKEEGTGLGLATVQSVVKRIGGAIQVESSTQHGSSFTLYLPAWENVSTEIQNQVDPDTVCLGGTEVIMVVDDEASIIKLMNRILAAEGYQVIAYTDASEAKRDFAERPDFFDCIITDMNMPKILGIDLARDCLHVRSDIPIILCTGYSEKAHMERAKEIALSGILFKPLDKKALLKLLHETLNGASATT